MKALSRPAGTPGGPNCGVTAAALLAGVSFGQMFNWMRTKYNKAPQWGGRAFGCEIEDAMRAHRVVLGERRFYLPRDRLTLKRWVKEKADPDKVYYVEGGRHAMVIHDGVVYDQGSPKGRLFAFHFAARYKVVLSYEVKYAPGIKHML